MSYFYEQESAAFKACVESLKKENKKVAVIGHVRPDGDCIGSTVAVCLLYTSPSPRDLSTSRMPSSA